MITIQDIHHSIRSGGLRLSHTSLFRGYVSRLSAGLVEPYKGRFGRGYAVRRPNWQSTRYSLVTYYIQADSKKLPDFNCQLDSRESFIN